MTETYVLNSYAVLALLGNEAGSEHVAQLLHQARHQEIHLLMTWVNAGKVAYIVERRWGKERLYQVLGTVEATQIEMIPAGRELTLAAASIKAEHPLVYADAFAAALALERQARLITGDPEFEQLEKVLSIQWLQKGT